VSDVGPGRLLVVDDSEANRDLLVRRLEPQGYDVATAANGREALERLAADPFDVVLLDIMMPELNGYQVLEQLRGEAGLPAVRVIMLSALDETESVVRCLELGADDYLTKPFNAALLRARVESSLARKRLRDREQVHARSLERELEIGREIQAEFLPPALPSIEGWEFAACLRSARQVGGDFYDAFPIDGSGRVGLAVADVCDKGVGAALFMALYRTMLRVGAGRNGAGRGDPSTVVRLANDYIATVHGHSNMFATMFFAILDPANSLLSFVNAGHEPPLVKRAGGRCERLEPTGPAVGLLPGAEFRTEVVRLESGDLTLAFSDGVTEARGADGSMYGDERLQEQVVTHTGSAGALLARVEADLARYVGDAPASDDVTMLALRRGA
jgi:sigma-B regulation protein RsbU (phosphoserine phosphatase)